MNRYGRTGWKGASGVVLLGCFSRKGSFRGRHHQFRQILPSWTRRRALMIDDWAVGAHCAGGVGRDPAKHAATGAASTGGAGRSRAVHAGDDALVRVRGRSGHAVSMDVLARIPLLPCPAVPVTAAEGIEVSCRPESVDPPCRGEISAVSLPEVVVSSPPEPRPAVSAGCSSRRRADRRRNSGRFPGGSVVVLAAVAAAVWAAAWRNDRLRWEAGRQQRPERLAQELPATAGAERSRTP